MKKQKFKLVNIVGQIVLTDSLMCYWLMISMLQREQPISGGYLYKYIATKNNKKWKYLQQLLNISSQQVLIS